MRANKSQDLSTPRSLYLDFRELLFEQLKADNSFKARYLLAEIESKLLDPEYSDPPEVRHSKAVHKWLQCEERNSSTNIRLMHHSEEDFLFLSQGLFPVMATDVLSVARRFIADAIGTSIPWDLLRGTFSGGASTSVRRGLGTIARKFQSGTDITEGAIMHFLRLTKSDVWAPRDFTIAGGNVLFTVPKTSLIDRCAAKEPDYNMYVQKAIGDFLRRKLKRVGVNLDDQTLNQRLSRDGSISSELATIDLSSASDSVSKQLVLLLLPEEWYYLMDDCRSQSTYVDGEWHLNEMFSSMGNAFTFELESLIFWALTRACAYLTQTPGKISVYGDDIICPSGLKDAILSTFEFCGFTINTKKSFFEGTFRESCGKHWDSGIDVTPFYVRAIPADVSDWCLLLNNFRRWCTVGDMKIADPTYFDLWSLFSECVPEPIKGSGDLASRSNLCSPGRIPIATVVRKQRRHLAMESQYSKGAYLHWLSTTEMRTVDPYPSGKVDASFHVTTSEFVSEDPARMVRYRHPPVLRDIPFYPQET